MQKLEWLARLEKPDLEELLKDLDPQKEGRSRVIKAVQRRLGVQAEAEQAATISADVLLKKWQKFVHQTLDAIESLGDDAATEERRKQLARQMQTEFLEIQEALDPPAEDEGDPVDDQDDEVEQGTQPSQDVTARPAPAALSAWSRRPR